MTPCHRAAPQRGDGAKFKSTPATYGGQERFADGLSVVWEARCAPSAEYRRFQGIASQCMRATSLKAGKMRFESCGTETHPCYGIKQEAHAISRVQRAHSHPSPSLCPSSTSRTLLPRPPTLPPSLSRFFNSFFANSIARAAPVSSLSTEASLRRLENPRPASSLSCLCFGFLLVPAPAGKFLPACQPFSIELDRSRSTAFA